MVGGDLKKRTSVGAPRLLVKYHAFCATCSAYCEETAKIHAHQEKNSKLGQVCV